MQLCLKNWIKTYSNESWGKKKSEAENKLIDKLISESQRVKLETPQLQLDELYMNKAKGAFTCSRARWLEKGKLLEKQRQNKNTIYLWNAFT